LKDLKLSKGITFFIVFSIFIAIWSTFELLYTGRIDLDGDAIWYFESAISGDYFENFYPIYPLFISYFGLNSPYITRFWQFAFVLLLTLILFRKVQELDWTQTAKKYFKYFYVSNFGLYLLIFQLVRDWIIFTLTVIIFLFYYSNIKPVRKTFLISLIVLLLIPISQVLPGVIAIAGFLTFIQFNVIKNRSAKSLFILALIAFIIYLAFGQYITDLLNRATSVFGEDRVLEDDASKGNIIIGFFNFLFGPGLIRPLFPSKYYMVFTYYFSFLTWVACISFIWQFSFVTNAVLNSRDMLNFSRRFFFSFYTFIFYVLVYVSAFGGPGGLRKRTVAYFLFSLSLFELLSKVNLNLTKVFWIRVLQLTVLIIFITSIYSF
jgi:hypothetical protein